jgi:hypothetical protein
LTIAVHTPKPVFPLVVDGHTEKLGGVQETGLIATCCAAQVSASDAVAVFELSQTGWERRTKLNPITRINTAMAFIDLSKIIK